MDKVKGAIKKAADSLTLTNVVVFVAILVVILTIGRGGEFDYIYGILAVTLIFLIGKDSEFSLTIKTGKKSKGGDGK